MRFIEGEPQISSEAVHVDETADFITGMNSIPVIQLLSEEYIMLAE